MTPLPESFHKDGFDFKMVKREGRVAMFRKAKSELNTGFEVVIVQRRKAETGYGHNYPARELMPNNEDWGTSGWTFATREAADIKFSELSSDHNTVL